MHSEDAIIAQARERERRFITNIKAHPGRTGFEHLLIYLEDNLLSLRELAKVRGLDFERCAEKYIDDVVEAWRRNVKNGKTSADDLRSALHAILEVL